LSLNCLVGDNLPISFSYLERSVKPIFGKNIPLAEILRKHMWSIHWQSFTQMATHSLFLGPDIVNQVTKMSNYCFKILRTEIFRNSFYLIYKATGLEEVKRSRIKVREGVKRTVTITLTRYHIALRWLIHA
jgi:hypothetical protein